MSSILQEYRAHRRAELSRIGIECNERRGRNIYFSKMKKQSGASRVRQSETGSR